MMSFELKRLDLGQLQNSSSRTGYTLDAYSVQQCQLLPQTGNPP